jgi:hypothetical protein
MSPTKHGHALSHDRMKLWSRIWFLRLWVAALYRRNLTPLHFQNIIFRQRASNLIVTLFWPYPQCRICSVGIHYLFLQHFTILRSIIISFTLKIFHQLLATSPICDLSGFAKKKNLWLIRYLTFAMAQCSKGTILHSSERAVQKDAMKQSPLICCDCDEEYLDRNVYPYLQICRGSADHL